MISGTVEKIPDDEPDLKDISDAAIDAIDDQVYTGKALQPAVTVKYDDQVLNEGTDYTVLYQDNKNIGTASVTVTGIGQYTGEKQVSFVINPAPVELSSLKAGKKQLTVKWSKGKSITGYEIQYSLKKNFKSAKSLILEKAKTVKVTIGELKS